MALVLSAAEAKDWSCCRRDLNVDAALSTLRRSRSAVDWRIHHWYVDMARFVFSTRRCRPPASSWLSVDTQSRFAPFIRAPTTGTLLMNWRVLADRSYGALVDPRAASRARLLSLRYGAKVRVLSLRRTRQLLASSSTS